MERFQLIRRMYLQGTISAGAALILAVTDEERQEIKDLAGLIEYYDGDKESEIDCAWGIYYIDCHNYYYEKCIALGYIYEMSRVNNCDDYCGIKWFDVIENYFDYYKKIQDDFDDFEQITLYRHHRPIMTMREYTAYIRFSTHRHEREIAEEWIAGNVVSVPRGLDLPYIYSHYHSLLLSSPT